MANKLNHKEQMLSKAKKLPGPGQYGAQDLCGSSLTNSAFKNPKNFSIGHETRFSVPTKKTDETAPVTYKPMDNLNQNYKSTFTKTAHTVFGKNNYSIIDQNFNLKGQHLSPGPGAYDRFSEFSGINASKIAQK